jgi:hypothetical protein
VNRPQYRPQHGSQHHPQRGVTRGHADSQKHVHFSDVSPQRREYDFDWELELAYWYSKGEMKSFNETRFDEADVLRKERGIRTSSRDDADALTKSTRNLFIGDMVTHALDDADDSHEITIRGIEHFVWPVLQKEMMVRKRELKNMVLIYSRSPMARKKDPEGIKLAEECAKYSSWARNVATERGVKYCEMKRGGGRGGGLLTWAHNTSNGQRHISVNRID